MNTLTKIVAFTLLSLPLLASAAGKNANAAMQVTFEVKESCTIQTAQSTQSASQPAKAAPAVACQLNTAYQAQATPATTTSRDSKAASAERQPAADGVWTITF